MYPITFNWCYVLPKHIVDSDDRGSIGSEYLLFGLRKTRSGFGSTVRQKLQKSQDSVPPAINLVRALVLYLANCCVWG